MATKCRHDHHMKLVWLSKVPHTSDLGQKRTATSAQGGPTVESCCPKEHLLQRSAARAPGGQAGGRLELLPPWLIFRWNPLPSPHTSTKKADMGIWLQLSGRPALCHLSVLISHGQLEISTHFVGQLGQKYPKQVVENCDLGPLWDSLTAANLRSQRPCDTDADQERTFGTQG